LTAHDKSAQECNPGRQAKTANQEFS